MKTVKLMAIAMSIVFATACKDNKKESQDMEEIEIEELEVEEITDEDTPKKLSITLSPKSGSNVEGTVNFTEKNGIVTMVGTFTGLEEGEHAIHIHEKADCSAADGTSAGGHWNPTGQPHGAWGASTGFHKGDIGNIKVNSNGRGEISLSTDEWCIGCGDDTKDILGKAIIVHIDPDDLTTQPTGAAGARIACAGIIE